MVQSGAAHEAGAAGSAPGEPHPLVTAQAALSCQVYESASLHVAGVLVWAAGSLDMLDFSICLKAVRMRFCTPSRLLSHM